MTTDEGSLATIGDSPMKVNILAPTATASYVPRVSFLNPYWFFGVRKPPFSLWNVPYMMADPDIRFTLWTIKGPIVAQAKWEVDCSDPDIASFVDQTIKTFFNTSATKALQAIEWGYAAAECVYEERDGMIQFKELSTPIEAKDSRLLTKGGKKFGVRVVGLRESKAASVVLAGATGFWHVHGREVHPYFGFSRLIGAYDHWFEDWTQGGMQDVIRIASYKYSLPGDVIRHPIGRIPIENGEIDADELSRRLISEVAAGGTIALPYMVDPVTGNQMWSIEEPRTQKTIQDLLDRERRLTQKKMKGMGVPPEVVEAEGTGAFAGRAVPFMSYYATLQEMLNWLIYDIDDQINSYLIPRNFGKNHPKWVTRIVNMAKESLKASMEEARNDAQETDQDLGKRPVQATQEKAGVPARNRLPNPRGNGSVAA